MLLMPDLKMPVAGSCLEEQKKKKEMYSDRTTVKSALKKIKAVITEENHVFFSQKVIHI